MECTPTPPTITLDEPLTGAWQALVAEAGRTGVEFVEHPLHGLVDGDFRIEDGLPFFRLPPGTPPLTLEDVMRLINGET